MFFQLEDGAGSSKKLKVNNSNRALTDSVTKGSDQDAAMEGRLFQFGSMPVNLTSANESAILYLIRKFFISGYLTNYFNYHSFLLLIDNSHHQQ